MAKYTQKNKGITTYRHRGGIQGGAIAPIKPKKMTLFTMILHNSENIIRDIRSFCCTLFCHSNVVKYASTLLQ